MRGGGEQLVTKNMLNNIFKIRARKVNVYQMRTATTDAVGMTIAPLTFVKVS